ncbi:MAG: signal peptide peptidase SppA [Pseudomonadota bacterium]
MKHCKWSLLFLFLVVTNEGLAQNYNAPQKPLGGEPPTAGVKLNAPAITGNEDASETEVNPGALGMLNSWSLFLHHSELSRGGRVQGAGDAILFASPFPWFKPLVFGLGFQWLRPPLAIGYENSVKLSFATGLRLSSSVSLGLGIHSFVCDHDQALSGLTTLDVGLLLRPFEWLATGLAIRNLTTPVYDGLPLQRIYDLELTLRPLLTRRLEMGLGLRIGERRGDTDPHFRLITEPLSGFRFFGQLEILRRDFYRTDPLRANDPAMTDVRATFGVEFNLEQVSLAVSTVLGRKMPLASNDHPLANDSAAGVFQGAGVTLKIRGENFSPLTTFRKRMVSISLKEKISQHRMINIIGWFRKIEQRDDVSGVLIKIDGFNAGWAQTQELRSWLQRLRRAGKKSYAYVTSPSAQEYYLAAAADQILLDPAGGIAMKGMASRNLYFQGLFEKVGVNSQFIRIGDFKSAPEVFTRKGPSPAAQKVSESLLSDLYSQLIGDLALDRKIPVSAMQETVEQGPFIPPIALSKGLVDELVEPGDLEDKISELSNSKLSDPRILVRSPSRWPVGPTIAVIIVEGEIVRGESYVVPLLKQHMVGDETIVSALTTARLDSNVKAVVLRINSPGGSAIAADRIWREVRRTNKTKPIVVSFADVAASGGYFAGCAGKRIFAKPATITGSIGIYTGKFDLSGLMSKLGLTSYTFKKGKRADMQAYDRPYTDEELKFILSRLQYYYRQFLRAVGDGRKMTMDEVHRLAQGRVWTGYQARVRNLVDAYGGLTDAIEYAKTLTGLSKRPVGLVVLPKEKRRWLSKAIKLVSKNDALPLPEAATQMLRGIPPVLLEAQPGEPLARMPYEIQF